MPTEISLQPEEKLIFKDTFHENSRTYPVTFAVTDRAVFVTREKHLAKESYTLERIPLSGIRQVFLSRERRRSVIISSALVFVFGLMLTVWMIIPILNGESTAKMMPLPPLIMIFGLIMPFLKKQRKALVVQLNDGIYKWKPQIAFNKYNQTRVQTMQQQFLAACRHVGVHVMEEIEY